MNLFSEVYVEKRSKTDDPDSKSEALVDSINTGNNLFFPIESGRRKKSSATIMALLHRNETLRSGYSAPP